MPPNAPQSPRKPHAGRVPARALTSSIKRSVLAMSMRFSYDARIRVVATATRSIRNSWTSTGNTHCITNSVQEFRLTRNPSLHA